MGNVYLRDNYQVGDLSVHFEESGSYVSYEDEYLSVLTYDDGSKLPSRAMFTETSFNTEERTFRGVLDYGDKTFNGAGSVTYEMIFDTQYVCVISGKIVYDKLDGKNIKNFGYDRCYTNTNLAEVVDVHTVQRLEEEGASFRTLNVFRFHEKLIRPQVVVNLDGHISATHVGVRTMVDVE